MTRQNATNFTAPGLQFPYGNADTDFFQAEDVQILAQAVDAHDHSSTLGPAVSRLAAGASVAGPLQFADGSAAAPSLTFGTDQDTGLYRAASDQVGIVTGGAARLVVGSSVTSLSGNLAVGGLIELAQIGATPANPTAGVMRLYPKNDGHIYSLSSAGVETDLSAVGLVLPLTQNLTFSPDNALDIGAAAANRPRTLYLAGRVLAGDGAQATPSLSFGSANSGLYNSGGVVYMSILGTPTVQFGGAQMNLTTPLAFGATVTAADLYLNREAANTLALRNGAAHQTLRIYDAYTDAANYQRLAVNTLGNVFRITTENAGTFPVADFELESKGNFFIRTNGSYRWYFTSTPGHLYAMTDNTVDIGSVGGNRPRDVFIGRNLQVVGTVQFSNAFTTTATAGAASALPGPPALYITVLDSGGTQRKIPAYNV